jgi:hypothetical protein
VALFFSASTLYSTVHQCYLEKKYKFYFIFFSSLRPVYPGFYKQNITAFQGTGQVNKNKSEILKCFLISEDKKKKKQKNNSCSGLVTEKNCFFFFLFLEMAKTTPSVSLIGAA